MLKKTPDFFTYSAQAVEELTDYSREEVDYLIRGLFRKILDFLEERQCNEIDNGRRVDLKLMKDQLEVCSILSIHLHFFLLYTLLYFSQVCKSKSFFQSIYETLKPKRTQLSIK